MQSVLICRLEWHLSQATITVTTYGDPLFVERLVENNIPTRKRWQGDRKSSDSSESFSSGRNVLTGLTRRFRWRTSLLPRDGRKSANHARTVFHACLRSRELARTWTRDLVSAHAFYGIWIISPVCLTANGQNKCENNQQFRFLKRPRQNFRRLIFL